MCGARSFRNQDGTFRISTMPFPAIGSRPFRQTAMRLSRSLLIAAPLLAFSPSALAADGSEADTRSGRLSFALRAGYQAPMGSAEKRAAQSDAASWGPSFGAEVNYGLSRYVLAGAFGDFSTFGAPDGCIGCSAQSLAFGLGVQYHLIEGTPFDPFIGFGLGYRTMRFERAGGETSYTGPLARVMVAGDWYPAPAFGFGPFLDLSLGRYVSRSPGEMGEGALHSFFTVGLRVVLEPFR